MEIPDRLCPRCGKQYTGRCQGMQEMNAYLRASMEPLVEGQTIATYGTGWVEGGDCDPKMQTNPNA